MFEELNRIGTAVIMKLENQTKRTLGQGFADKVFRVFKENHAEVEIIPINACSRVLGMIKHVQRV